MKQKIPLIIIAFFMVDASSAQKDLTKYIDPTIGNVAQFLVPTYPTMHLPNQMIRMFPVRQDYISDQITAFPLQVISHRAAGILQLKATLGEIKNSSWEKKMNIDHDLEVVHPWLYSTYLIDDNIRVSVAPGQRCAIYKIAFPDNDKNNLMIKGSSEMKGTFNGGIFTFEEKDGETSGGINPVTTEVVVYVYGELRDKENNLTINSPVFETTTINLTNGNKFTVIAKGSGKTKKYIQKAFINGREIDSPFITHEQIMAGAKLELVLSDLPNKEWGKKAKIPEF